MAERNKFPWFQFDAIDVLTQERFTNLTDTEMGVVVRLAAYLWLHGVLPERNESSTVASDRSRSLAVAWMGEKREILDTIQQRKSEQAREAGRKSALARSGIYPTPVNARQRPSTEANVGEGQEKDSTVQKPTTSRFALPDWIPADAWKGYLEVRAKKRAPATHRALTGIVSKLEGFKAQGMDPGQVLDQSTERGYTGVFPLRSDNSHGGQYAPAKPLPDYLTRNLAAPRPGDRASVPGRRDELVGAASRQPRHGENGGHREAGTPVRPDPSSDLEGDAGRS